MAATLDDVLREVRALKNIVLVIAGGPLGSASDRYADRPVAFDPREGWKGPSFKGKKFSECPAAFLVALAEALDTMAERAERKGETFNDKPVAPMKRKDAARARRWAVRKLLGAQEDAPPSAPAAAHGPGANGAPPVEWNDEESDAGTADGTHEEARW